LRLDGRSLLPVGVREVSGEFHRGDVIAVVDEQGLECARGLANYAAAEARLLAGRGSHEIEALIGYVAEPELIHRDNLVLSE
jgi:glutamate 5-kinase